MRYAFSLESAVDDCPEYLIPRGELLRLAGECGLQPVQIINFPEFYMKYRERPAYERLLSRMGVVGDRGEFLNEEEQEVAELYLVFAFKKIHEPTGWKSIEKDKQALPHQGEEKIESIEEGKDKKEDPELVEEDNEEKSE